MAAVQTDRKLTVKAVIRMEKGMAALLLWAKSKNRRNQCASAKL
jgi:hypothetical protein